MYKNFSKYLNSNLRLSVKSFLIFSPVSIAAVPFSFSFREDRPPILLLALFGFLITSITLFFFWFLSEVSKRKKLSSFLWANLLILIFSGVIRGLSFYYLLDIFDIQNPSPLFGRILNSTFTVVFWVGLISLLIESNQRFKRRYQALLTQILILKLRDGERPDPGYAHLASEIARMQLKIKATIQDRQPEIADAQHAEALASALRTEIDQVLRPLSQRLWINSLYAPPVARINSVISTAITELNYPFVLTGSLYAFANIVNTTQSLGITAGVLFATGTFLAFSVAEYVRRDLTKRLSRYTALLNLSFVLVVGIFVGLSVNWTFSLLDLNYSYFVAVFTSPSLPGLIIAVASIKLTLQDRKSITEILSRKLARNNKDNLDLVSHGNAASYLHNSLQSELTALALQLDSVAQDPDPERNRIVMEKLEALVSQSKSEDFKNFLETPELRLNRIVNSWDGIAKISLKLDPLIWMDSSRSSIVVSLIQEAIANSVRSGRANRVEVDAHITGDSIEVTITDNGSGALLTKRRGIGSQWIDRVVISDWKLEDTKNGRVLRVEI